MFKPAKPKPFVISTKPPRLSLSTKWCAMQIGRYTHKVRIQAMRAGIEKLGGVVVDAYHPHPMTVRRFIEGTRPRFAFTCGEHWTENAAREELARAGVPLVVMDLGYFKRATGPRDANGYNQVGLGSLCWTPPTDVPSDRWERLQIPDALPPATGRERIALVLGQCANDSQHKMNAQQLHAWFADKTRDLRADGWRIIYRPHPSMRGVEPAATWADSTQTNADMTLAQGLAIAARVVTFNSTAGLDAILAGVPVTCSPTAHYAKVAEYGSGMATHAQAMQHMHRLAYSQWLCEEIAEGLPLRFLNRFAPLLPSPLL